MRLALPLLAACLLAALALFAAWPDVDLATAQYFYGLDGFIGRGASARALRAFFNYAPFVVLAAYALAWGLRRLGRTAPFHVGGRALVFLILTFAIGPGLIVNLGLKDHTHRPRPIHLKQFGGGADFRPWDSLDGACVKNCSFPSGEAAGAFWMVAPASLALPPLRGVAIGAALIFGVATSLLRMAFGGHFLSDVIVGGLIALVVIEIVRRFLPAPGRGGSGPP